MVKNLPPIQEIYSEDIFSKLDPMNSNLNKSIIKHEQPFNFSEPKSSNLLDQLCKINILDAIIHPTKYSYCPSYFNHSSILYPLEFSPKKVFSY